MDKDNVIYTYSEIFTLKKKQTLAIMNLENITLGKISQSEKNKYYMSPLIWGV